MVTRESGFFAIIFCLFVYLFFLRSSSFPIKDHGSRGSEEYDDFEDSESEGNVIIVDRMVNKSVTKLVINLKRLKGYRRDLRQPLIVTKSVVPTLGKVYEGFKLVEGWVHYFPDTDIFPQNYWATNCSVVASSPIILEKEYGEEIDSHEIVVRLNDAPTIGYEKHVGTKTTWRFINSKNQKNVEVNQVFFPNKTYIGKVFHNCFGDVWSPRNILRSPSKFDYCSNPWIWTYYIGKIVEEELGFPARDVRFSTGFRVIFMMLQVCTSLDIYGFDWHQRPDLPVHYFEDDHPSSSGHNYDTEKEIMEFLNEIGLLRIRR